MVSQSIDGDRVPLDEAELANSLKPFGQSRMLPRAAYTSEEVFAWEQQHFFEGGWTCLGRSDVVGAAGDQHAEAVGRGGVLLIRGQDGVARAFANTCRHRGHELLPCGQSVNRPIVLCPYHAWSYRLSGALRKAPGFEEEAYFEPAGHGLVELPCEEWHGLLFVDASGGAGRLEEHLAGLSEIVAPYEIERLVVAGRHDYVVSANWKILSENYQECYHCPVIHPELCAVSPPKSGENYVHPGGGAWVGGFMEIREGMATMSLDGTTPSAPLRGLDEHRRHIVDYVGIFPNVLVSLHPDYVMTHVLTPLSAGTTRVECAWHFASEDVGRPDFDPSFAVDFWDITNRQDWMACESVQRGLSNPRAIPGPLSAEEDGVYQLVTMVARGYSGLPLRAAVPTSA
ncbi:MAG: aromatic ring-hydroxylating oxygenase subunit alpha [Acidimicrobiales bacterium]